MPTAATHRHDGEPALVPIRRRAFAFDMDGVIYRGPELIPGAAEAVAAVQHLGLPTLFITNNSRETPVELAAKLQGLGISAGPESIVSAVVASVSYLRTHHPAPCRVLVLGSGGLAAQIAAAGYDVTTWEADDVPAVVVVGVDFELTYAKLRRATRAIMLDGATYLAVNTDPHYPTPSGPVPGAGAITAAVTAVTGQEPVIVGKPSAHMFQVIMERAGVAAADLVAGRHADRGYCRRARHRRRVRPGAHRGHVGRRGRCRTRRPATGLCDRVAHRPALPALVGA